MSIQRKHPNVRDEEQKSHVMEGAFIRVATTRRIISILKTKVKVTLEMAKKAARR